MGSTDPSTSGVSCENRDKKPLSWLRANRGLNDVIFASEQRDRSVGKKRQKIILCAAS
jgi:hypothetical protein